MRWPIRVVALMGIVGCGSELPSPEPGTRQDSAGIAIGYESVRDPAPLELQELVRIGPALEEPFYRVSWLDRTASGDLFVVQGGSPMVRRFAADGRLLDEWGREGDGPGEFRAPRQIAVARDTVVVTSRGRVTFFSTDGDLLATVSTPGISTFSVFADPDGWLVSALPFGDPQEQFRFHRVLPDSGLAAEPQFAYSARPEPHSIVGAAGYVASPPFASRIAAGWDGNGSVVTSSRGGYELSYRATDGSLREITRVDYNPVPVTSADVEAWEQRQCPPAGECTGEAAEWMPTARRLAVPESRPPVGILVLGADGTLLVSRPDLDPNPFAPGDPAEWDYFDEDSRYVGRITLLERFRPLVLSGNQMWGVAFDSLNVMTVAGFAIRTPS